MKYDYSKRDFRHKTNCCNFLCTCVCVYYINEYKAAGIPIYISAPHLIEFFFSATVSVPFGGSLCPYFFAIFRETVSVDRVAQTRQSVVG